MSQQVRFRPLMIVACVLWIAAAILLWIAAGQVTR
jgi:hypothetical protein